MKTRSRVLSVLLSASMVFTSFSVPVMAEEIVPAVEESVETEAVEEVLTEETAEEVSGSAQEISEEAVEQVAGVSADADTYYEVRNLEELMATIADAPSNKKVAIRLMTPYSMLNDSDYSIADKASYEIPAGKDIVIELNGRSFNFDSDSEALRTADYEIGAKLTVASGAKLELKSNSSSTLRLNIVNEGVLKVNRNISVKPYAGAAFVNNGEAYLDGVTLSANEKDIATVENNGHLVVDDSSINNDMGTSAEGKTSCAILNKGELIVEDASEIYHSSGAGDSYGIVNAKDAKAAIRGMAHISTIGNKGKLTVGRENTPDDNTGGTTQVSVVYTTDDGVFVLHNGAVSNVAMAYASEGASAASASGKFVMVGGTVNNITYTNVLPELYGGTVYSLRPVKADLSAEDLTLKKFVSYFEAKKADSIDAFIPFDEDRFSPSAKVTAGDSKEYVVATSIVDGIPYYNDIPLFGKVVENDLDKYKPIKSLEDFKAAAADAEGGNYYMDMSDDLVIETPIDIVSPYFSLFDYVSAERSADDAEHHYNYDIVLKNNGSLTVKKDAYFSLSVDLDAMDNKSDAIVVEAGAEMLSTDLIFGQDIEGTLINNSGTFNKWYSQIKSKNGAGAVIKNAADASMQIDASVIAEKAKADAIVNEGTLSLSGSYTSYITPAEVSGEEVTGISLIKNVGTLHVGADIYSNVDSASVIANTESGIANICGDVQSYGEKATVISNEGKLVIDNDANVQTLGKESIVINNLKAGELKLVSGTISAYSSGSDEDRTKSYAIVYAENEPILVGGTVKGSRGTSYEKISDTNPVLGSAVVLAGDKAGSFKNGVNKTSIPSLNAGVIYDGAVNYTGRVYLNKDYKYVLMEQGESIRISDALETAINDNTFGVESYKLVKYVISDEGVAAVKNVKKSVYDPENYPSSEDMVDVIEATGTGMTTVKAFVSITEEDQFPQVEDYLVIESVKKGEREKIAANSYEVELAEPNPTINSYQYYYNIGLDWNIANYDSVTGAYDLGNNFEPEGVIITGATEEADEAFNKYFDYNDALGYDPHSKNYYITVSTKADTTGTSSVLLQDLVKSVDDLNVTIVARNTVSKKTLEIPCKTKLNINISYVKPSIKFDKITLNGALQNAGAYLYDYVKSSSSDFHIKEIVNDYGIFDYSASYLVYSGPAKSGSYKLAATVAFDNYGGEYQTVIPVTIKPVFPKAKLTASSAVIPVEAANYANRQIATNIAFKTETEASCVSSVTVVGNNNFEVASLGDTSFDGKMWRRGVVLKPRTDVAKGEKLKLRVNYSGLKANKGKKHVSDLNFSVKAVTESKYSLGKPYATTLYCSADEDKTVTRRPSYIGFASLPFYYTDGYVVGESLDGKVEIKDESADVSSNGIVNDMDLIVYATDKLKASDKAVAVKLTAYNSAGTVLGKPVVVKVPVDFKPSTVSEIKPVTINLARDSFDEEDYTVVAKVKTSKDVELDSYSTYNINHENKFFDFSYDGAGKLYVTPKLSALDNGYIIPGSSYTYTMRFITPYGTSIERQLVVNVADVKKVKLWANTDLAKLSVVTPYSRACVEIGSIQPYGLTVDTIELDPASAAKFEISTFTVMDSNYSYHITDKEESLIRKSYTRVSLQYKNNKLPAGIKAGTQKVTFNVKYTNGAVGKITVPVEIGNGILE